MAGTSQSGWAATDPDLFDGAMWMVATADDTDPDAWRVVASLALAAARKSCQRPTTPTTGPSLPSPTCRT